MGRLNNLLTRSLDEFLLPRGFIHTGECYFHWNTSTDIVTVICAVIMDSTEFYIGIGAVSIYQGIYFKPIQNIPSFFSDIVVLSHHYGLEELDNVNRNYTTFRRKSYTLEEFDRKIVDNIRNLKWLLDNVYCNMDILKLYDSLSSDTGYRDWYYIPDIKDTILRPEESSIYLAVHLGNYSDAAKTLLLLYNRDRRFNGGRFEGFKNELNLEQDALFDEWYKNTFARSHFNPYIAVVFYKPWIQTEGERVVNIIAEELYRKRNIMHSRIRDAAEHNIRLLNSLIDEKH